MNKYKVGLGIIGVAGVMLLIIAWSLRYYIDALNNIPLR